MKRNLFYFLIFTFCFNKLKAQSVTLDKNKVMDFFQNQQFDEAVNYLSPIVINDSTNIQALSFLAYANYMNDNIKTAEKYYLKIFSIDSNNINALNYLSVIKSFSKPEEAQQYTLRLINLQPNKASHYRNMGSFFNRKNQKDSALIFYKTAYQLAPDDYKNGTGFAEILIDTKNFINADSIINKGLIKDSLNIFYLKLKIRSAYEQKNYQNALVAGEKLIQLEDISLTALTQLSLSYYYLKMYSDCIRVCEYLDDHEIAGESIYFYEAKSLAKLKDYKKSNELYQKCIAFAISKTAENYYYNLGENYEALKEYKQAVANYDTAFYLFKNPVMLYECGRIYESNFNNIKLAQKYYAKYLSVAKPETPDEKKAYAYVKSKQKKKAK
jgi:tetratricopeptide (TPR) repeat protein